MKAKEYQQLLLVNGELRQGDQLTKKLTDIMTMLYLEVKDISKARRSTSDETMVSIFKELDLKWAAILKLDPSLERARGAFKDFSINTLPMLAIYW